MRKSILGLVLLLPLFSSQALPQTVDQMTPCPALEKHEQVLVDGISEVSASLKSGVIFAKILRAQKDEKKFSRTTLMVETDEGSAKSPRQIQQVQRHQIAKKEGCLRGFCTQDRVLYRNHASRIIAINRCNESFWLLDEMRFDLNIGKAPELLLLTPNPYFSQQHRQKTHL